MLSPRLIMRKIFPFTPQFNTVMTIKNIDSAYTIQINFIIFL